MTELNSGESRRTEAELASWAEEHGLARIERDDSLPESTPVYAGPPLPEREKSIDEQEIDLAHAGLDTLGVPRTRELSEEETWGHVRAEHDLRLHGRIRILQERLAELGVEHLFTDES
jgi:hypothetical protein